jgi:hypothetical protein
MLCSIALASVLTVAAQSPTSWVVLIKSDGSVPASWSQNLQDAVKEAASGSSRVKWLPPPQVSLEDAQLALGCSSWDKSCVGQIAGMMNADAALSLELEKRGKGAWLTYQVIGNNGKVLAKKKKFEVPDRGSEGLKVARVVAASAVTGKPVTVVAFSTDVAGAEVFVDGEKVGKTPITVAADISPGSHKVEFKMEGRAPVTQNVDVAAGKVTKVGAVMATASSPPPDDPVVGDDPETGDDPEVQPDPGPQPVNDPPPPAAGGIDPLFGFITLGAAGAIAVTGLALYGGHLYVGFDARAKPCVDPADLEVDPSLRDCESQQEAFERLERDGESIAATMDALYWSFIAAEVVAAVVGIAGAGLLAASFLMEDAE